VRSAGPVLPAFGDPCNGSSVLSESEPRVHLSLANGFSRHLGRNGLIGPQVQERVTGLLNQCVEQVNVSFERLLRCNPFLN
jgi:hypothetical protein